MLHRTTHVPAWHPWPRCVGSGGGRGLAMRACALPRVLACGQLARSTHQRDIVKVPFIDILRYEAGFSEAVVAKAAELIKNGHFAGGPAIGQFEQAIRDRTQSAHALGCANGTDAIQLALRAAGVNKDDKVLIPDMTFWATFEAVVNVGAVPCTLDVSRET